MLALVVWVTIGFVSGAIPWAIIVGKLLVGKDVRTVGDGNPGSVNAWKLGGLIPGVLSTILELSKGLVPVYFAFRYLDEPSGITSQASLALVAIAPIVGHAWSPFLRFKGGKALAASMGSWTAITGGLAFPVACILLGLIHGTQKNHAITVTIALIGLLFVFLPPDMELFIVLFWASNLIVVFWKHRTEYSDGVIWRNWALKAMRLLS